jgi:hypothetical protein
VREATSMPVTSARSTVTFRCFTSIWRAGPRFQREREQRLPPDRAAAEKCGGCADRSGRSRHRRVSGRALQIRAILLERCIAVRQGHRFFASRAAAHTGRTAQWLSPRMMQVIGGAGLGLAPAKAGRCPTQDGLMEANIQGVTIRRTTVHRACDQATFSAVEHL